jgi:hypothetical protein
MAPKVIVMYSDDETSKIESVKERKGDGSIFFSAPVPNKSVSGAEVAIIGVWETKTRNTVVVHEGPLDCQACGHKCACEEMTLRIPAKLVRSLRRHNSDQKSSNDHDKHSSAANI